jgi:nucleoside-diphosphate-sugar epimerase
VPSTSVTDPASFAREVRLVESVLERCAWQRQTVVLLSTASFSMYGAPDCPGTEDSPVTPTNPCGEHKLALETLVRDSGVDHVILRVSHLIGDGQREHQLLPGLTRQITAGRVTVHQGAHRDLLDVRHLTGILDRLLRSGDRRALVNASGSPSLFPGSLMASSDVSAEPGTPRGTWKTSTYPRFDRAAA